MLVTNFVRNRTGAFPDSFYDCLPQYCFEDNCGYPMEMTETLTQLHCSNPKCPSKVAQRLKAMANTLGVKGLGDAIAIKFVNNWGITNPLMIFTYEPLVDGAMCDGVSVETSEKIASQFRAKNKFTLSEFIKIANLPFIQTSALAIFGEYDDLYEVYEDIEEGGVEWISKKLDINKGDDLSIRAIKVYESLMTFKDDLLRAVNWVEIIPTNTEDIIKLTAVCSDEVGNPFRTKADFYATVNNRNPRLHVEFLGSATSSIDYLIWAGADGSPARHTNKVKKVTAFNEKYEKKKAEGKLKEGDHYIPIVTALEFLAIVDKKLSE